MSNYTDHETATIQPSRTAFTMDALLDDMEVPTMANDTDFVASFVALWIVTASSPFRVNTFFSEP